MPFKRLSWRCLCPVRFSMSLLAAFKLCVMDGLQMCPKFLRNQRYAKKGMMKKGGDNE